MREIYAERLAVLLECAREKLAGLLEISESEAGLQTVGWLRKGMDAESATRAAAARDVEVFPLSRYSRGRFAREGLQTGLCRGGRGGNPARSSRSRHCAERKSKESLEEVL